MLIRTGSLKTNLQETPPRNRHPLFTNESDRPEYFDEERLRGIDFGTGPEWMRDWAMRLRIGAIVAVGWFLSVLSPLAFGNLNPKPVELSAEEKDWIARHPVVRVGIVTNWAPYGYSGPDGSVLGIDADILKIISERTGLKFKLVPIDSWENLAQQWEQQELDMATSAAQSIEREKVAVFTEPYSAAPIVIVEREDGQEFGPIAVLRHATIAMPSRHITTRELPPRLPSAKIILRPTQEKCFELVAKGEADATLSTLLVASHYLNQHPNIDLGISGVVHEFAFPLRFAASKDPDDKPLVGILNKGLASLSLEEIDNAVTRHVLFDLQGAMRVQLMQKRILQVLLGGGLVGALLLLWGLSLRREIRARCRAEAELQKANQSLEIFSHSLSHDLKAPLRAITGFTEALQEDYRDKMDEEGQEYLGRISGSVARMYNLVNDVLDYTRASNSPFPLEPIALEPLLQQVIGEFPPEERQHFHLISPLPVVEGSASLLQQCMANLLSNAIKFVPRDRTPNIRIHGEHQGSLVKICVEDNGIGIAPKDQQRIFKLFERVGSTESAGTGIGLAVVAKGIERMGGNIHVESAVGQGSRFWIHLRAPSPEKSAVEPRREQHWYRRRRRMEA